MKKLGCVLLVVLVGVGVVAAFVVVTIRSITSSEDQSGLTREVPVVVLHPEKVGGGGSGNSRWKFDYAYEADGTWYGYADYLIPASSWSPGDGARACLDPENPRRHVLATDEQCGLETTDLGAIHTATPRPAPRQR